jgi:hypothetical protein
MTPIVWGLSGLLFGFTLEVIGMQVSQDAAIIDLVGKATQALFTTAGPIILAWIAYKVAVINKTATATHSIVNHQDQSLIHLQKIVSLQSRLLELNPSSQVDIDGLKAARAEMQNLIISKAITDSQ